MDTTYKASPKLKAEQNDKGRHPRRKRLGRASFFSALTAFTMVAMAGNAYAEGSAQYELGQHYLNSSLTDLNKNLYVDILNIGEVINISACGDQNTDDLEFRLFDPNGIEVIFNGRLTPGITLTSSNVDCANPMTAPLTNPVRYTSVVTGTYRLTVRNLNGTDLPRLNRLDVTVTTNAAVNPDPTAAAPTSLAGRLYSLHWQFDALGFSQNEATNADFYMLTPGGVANTNYVWQLDLNEFAGFVYDIIGNSLGVDSPNAAQENVAGLSVPFLGNSYTPEFPVYLNFPEIANAPPSSAPVVTGFSFEDDAGQDNGISPGNTVGVQDSGVFEFTTDVSGTYGINIDTNEDGIFGNTGDTVLLGTTAPGANQVIWDGRDNNGDVLPIGQYQAQLVVRTGEFHFVAADAETSGGPADDGLTIFQATSATNFSPTLVFWDDLTIFPNENGPNQGSSNTPDGGLSGTPAGYHSWGIFSPVGAENFGDGKLIDTFVYGLSTAALSNVSIVEADAAIADATITITPTSNPGDTLTVSVSDGDRNLDSAAIDTVTVALVNDVTGEVETLVLSETGVDTGVFSNTIATTFGVAAGTDNDGTFNTQAADTITATYSDEFNSTSNPVSRTATSNVVGGVNGTVLIDATSQPGDIIALSVTDADLNGDAGVAETLSVQVVNDATGEVETVTLTETGVNTGVFAGSVATQFGPAAGTDNDGTFNTKPTDTLTVTYNDALTSNGGTASVTDQNSVVGGATGTITIAAASQPGDDILVSVSDADLNADPALVETVSVQLVNDVTGEIETVLLTETGANTGVFEETVATVFGAVAGTDNDGTFNSQAGDTITATYNDAVTAAGNSATVTEQGAIVGGATGTVSITDPSSPGDGIILSVSDADLNVDAGVAETVTVQLVNDVTGESETVLLTETGVNTGLFEATVATQFGAVAGADDDGSVNTQAGDTLTVTYNDALTATGAAAVASDTGNVVGGITGTVSIDSDIVPGDNPLIIVSDGDLNADPALAETVSVQVVNDATGEVETVLLTETGVNTGIFQENIATVFGAVAGADNDGTFNVQATDTLTVTYNDDFTATGGTASPTALSTVNGGVDGTVAIDPTSQPGDTLNVSVADADLNADAGVAETISVALVNDVTGEAETLVLTETGVNTGIFEGTIATVFGAAAGTDNDGTFNTKTSDTITVSYADDLTATGGTASPTAQNTVGGGITGAISLAGPVTPGEDVTVTVTDGDLNTNDSLIETVSVTVLNDDTGESETIVLSETGPATGVFEGSVATVFGAASGTDDDGSFNVVAGQTLTGTYADAITAGGGPASPTDSTSINGGVDGTVTATNNIVPGADILITVADADLDTDPAVAEQVMVSVVNDATGESETLTLTETGVNTGIFSANQATNFGAVADADNNGTLNVQAGDTLTTTYADALTATGGTAAPIAATTVNGGETGTVEITASINPGDALDLQVTDADLNADPASVETVSVGVVNDVNGETETVILTETGPATGIFTAQLPTVFGTAAGTDEDGVIAVQAADTVTVTYNDALTVTGATASPEAQAAVAGGGDGAISLTPTSEPGDELVATVTDSDLNTDPALVETISINLINDITGESETLTLTETGPATGVFQGTIATVFGDVAGTNDDGSFNTQAGDTITASYTDQLTTEGGTALQTAQNTVIGGVDGTISMTASADPGDPLTITVNDNDLNTDPAANDTVSVSVVNQVTGESETVLLTETGPATGVFEAALATAFGATAGPDNDGTIFAQSGDAIVATYNDDLTSTGGMATVSATTAIGGGTDGAISASIDIAPGEALLVSVADDDLNTNDTTIETVDVLVVNDVTGETETVTLTETGAATGVFEASVPSVFGTAAGANGDGAFVVQTNDTLTATYQDAFTQAGGTATLTSVTTVTNTPPIANDDSGATQPGEAVSLPVLANDSDAEGQTLTITSVVQPDNGTVTFSASGTVIYTPADGFTGVDSFTYTIDDGLGGSAMATVTIAVDNNTPTAVADSAGTQPEMAVTIDVLANDSDPNGDALSVANITDPDNGTVVINPDGTITYTPNAGFIGMETLTYTMCDGDANCDTAIISVNVSADTPQAVDDIVAVNAGTPVTVNPVANDTDPNGDDLTITNITEAANGVATLNPDGTVSYSPKAGFVGTDTFAYTVCDGAGNCDTATITVNVNNTPPIANDDSGATQPGEAVSIPVLANDSDPEGQAFEISAVTQPANGTVTFTPQGTVIYTPADGFTGSDSFTYTIDDGLGGTATASVVVAVDNNTPTAIADSAGTQPGVPVTIEVLANDSDPNADELTVTAVSTPANGVVVINADGTLTFTPDSGFSGTDSFSYTVCDGDENCDTAIVSVIVSADSPQATDDVLSISSGTAVTFDPLENDTDPNGDTLSVSSVTDPANGTITLNPDGTVTYSPDDMFVGTDTVAYTACDPAGNCDTATITVNIENQAPVAGSDSAATQPGDAVSVPVLVNDSDPENQPLSIASVTQAGNGTVSFSPEGTVVYTPVAGFTGTDSFTYTVQDALGGTDIGTVTVSVDNNTPTATADSIGGQPDGSITIDVLANDTDPNGDILAVASVTEPANGTVTINPDGTITYTPANGFTGSDSFTYTACDSDNNCDTAVVSVAISADAPQAGDVVAQGASDTSISIDPLINTTDPNGDPLTVTGITDPANGTATLNPDGTVTYTPDAGFVGTDIITFTVCDPSGNCDTATLTVILDNQPPIANNDSAATQPGRAISIPVTANDSDPEGQALMIAAVTQPENGTTTFNEDGTVIYTPAAGFTGSDSFTYTLDDGLGGTASATVSIIVDNATPTAIADSIGVQPGTPAVIDLLANDSDPNGDDLSLAGITQPENGTVDINPDGTVTFTPAPGFTGADSFTYTVCDPEENCDSATVSVIVNDNIPQAQDDLVDATAGQSVTFSPLDNDTDPNDTLLTITEVSAPANGQLTVNPDGTFTYTPDAGFQGIETITYWVCNEAGFCDTASITIDSRITASIEGIVFLDQNSDDVRQPNETLLSSYIVEIVADDGSVVATSVTDDNGFYEVEGLEPGVYMIKFRNPQTGTVTGVIAQESLSAGENVVDLNLPIDPSGVVYDSLTGAPLSGIQLTLTDDTGAPVPTSCLVDPSQQNQITGSDGMYRFDLVPGGAAQCPTFETEYQIEVTLQNGLQAVLGALPANQVLLPSGQIAGPLDATSCPIDAVPGPTCEVDASVSAPSSAADAFFYTSFLLASGDADVVNNHIPVDLVQTDQPLIATKTATVGRASTGSLVSYTITVRNDQIVDIVGTDIVDELPAGFKYVEASGRLNGVAIEPSFDGRQITWSDVDIAAGQSVSAQLVLIVGAGVQPGDHINQAYADNGASDLVLSNIAEATVRVVPDEIFDCSEVIGKVFNDLNANGYQDEGEDGIQGVRIATVKGLLVTTDEHGRYHIACAATPRQGIGSNFILKVDPRTLPSGYRVTTENPRVIRLTEGKMSKANFGASLSRIVNLDVSDAAFERNSTQLRASQEATIRELIKTLEEDHAVLKLTYIGNEKGRARLKALVKTIRKEWRRGRDRYDLSIETRLVNISGEGEK